MADITQRGQMIRDDSGFPVAWNLSYSSATGSTIVKSTGGVLHSITFNKPTATTVLTIYNAASAGTGTIASITVPASPQPLTLFYDANMPNGISTNMTVAASDITISYI